MLAEQALAGLLREKADVQHEQRNDGKQERQSIEGKTPGGPQKAERQATQHRAHHDRGVELDGIEGDGIGHVLFRDEGGDEGGVGGSAKRLPKAGDEGGDQKMPDLDDVEPHQEGEKEARTTICTHWEKISMWRRSKRSASTPPTSEKRKIGMAWRMGSRASNWVLPLIFQMSQPCATICIQVPMAEAQAPIHMRRKSRY